MEIASQLVIFAGPISALTLGAGSPWGFVIGLAIQPFWFYTSFRHRQWGIFIASNHLYYCLGHGCLPQLPLGIKPSLPRAAFRGKLFPFRLGAESAAHDPLNAQ
jgi:hypothetical protein